MKRSVWAILIVSFLSVFAVALVGDGYQWHNASEVVIEMNGYTVTLQDAIDNNYFGSEEPDEDSVYSGYAHDATEVIVTTAGGDKMTLQEAAENGVFESGSIADGTTFVIQGHDADSINVTSNTGEFKTLQEAIDDDEIVYVPEPLDCEWNQDMDFDHSSAASFLGSDDGDGAITGVNSVGDINNDGYDDIVMGSYYTYNTANSGVSIFFGKETGWENNLDVTTGNVFIQGVINPNYPADQSGTSSENLGYAVSSGDINGDGYSDIMLGAPYAGDHAFTSSASAYSQGWRYQGKVYVFLGKEKSEWGTYLQSTSADIIFEGESLLTYLGYAGSISSGDINGDGYDDILMSTNLIQGDGTQPIPSKVYIFYGKATGWSDEEINVSTADAIISFGNIGEYEYIKRGAYSLGDINNDGKDDIILSGKVNSSAFILFGGDLSGTINMLTDYDIMFYHETYAPQPLISSGDINGDDISDVILAVPYRRYTSIFFGKESWDRNINISSTVPDVNMSYQLKSANSVISSLGDINNDDINDIVIGDVYLGDQRGGGAYIIYGKEVWPETMIVESDSDAIIASDGYHLSLGSSISTGGDINGDSYDDILVGKFGAPGKVSLFLYGICGECISHSYEACYDNDVYWFDGCGEFEDMITDCGTTTSIVLHTQHVGSGTAGCGLSCCVAEQTQTTTRTCEDAGCISYTTTQWVIAGPCPSSSGTVICTELYNQGIITEEEMESEAEYRAEYFSQDILKGYRSWGVPVVRAIRNYPEAMSIVEPMVEAFMQEIQYRNGEVETGNEMGALFLDEAVPLFERIGILIDDPNWQSLFEEESFIGKLTTKVQDIFGKEENPNNKIVEDYFTEEKVSQMFYDSLGDKTEPDMEFAEAFLGELEKAVEDIEYLVENQ